MRYIYLDIGQKTFTIFKMMDSFNLISSVDLNVTKFWNMKM